MRSEAWREWSISGGAQRVAVVPESGALHPDESGPPVDSSRFIRMHVPKSESWQWMRASLSSYTSTLRAATSAWTKPAEAIAASACAIWCVTANACFRGSLSGWFSSNASSGPCGASLTSMSQ